MPRYIATPENMEILDALTKSLTELAPGKVLPIKTIDNLARGKRHLVTKARQLVQRSEGCVFATVIGSGIKKLEDENVASVGRAARLRSFRTVTRARDDIVAVIRRGSATINRQTMNKMYNEANKLGLISEFCRDDPE